MKKKTKQEYIYCTKCGEDLIRTPVPAEKAMIQDWNKHPLGTKYNKETGMRQFGIRVFCTNYRWWHADHINFIDEDSLHDSDLPELVAME